MYAKAGFNTQPPEGGCQRRAKPRLKTGSFQNTAARRRLPPARADVRAWRMFQHTAARRRLRLTWSLRPDREKFQHTAARRRLRRARRRAWRNRHVSTHSRPKAAACGQIKAVHQRAFQHTAARRRLRGLGQAEGGFFGVSTHSRPKAAARAPVTWSLRPESFNTQPPEGGCPPPDGTPGVIESFQHTAARRRLRGQEKAFHFSGGFNTQPPEGGCPVRRPESTRGFGFQHTAARRRLRANASHAGTVSYVSTHSRPKAAAEIDRPAARIIVVSTHSRPKAAARGRHVCGLGKKFQHTAARRRLPACTPASVACYSFNTQPPEGGCPPGLARRAGWQCFNTQPPEGGCSLLENSLKIRQLEATFR